MMQQYKREPMISTGLKQMTSYKNHNSNSQNNPASESNSNQSLKMIPELPIVSDERRKNQKNKFINKIKTLQEPEGKREMTTFYLTHNSHSVASSGLSDRRQRNKIAARESRDRKKLYVKLMEAKVANVQRQILETANQIQKVRLDIFSAQMHEGSQGKEAKHKQIHIIKKVEGLLADLSHQQRNNQINICIDSIIYRIGALGRERKSALNKLYHDLLNFSQPALYRYILWSAVQRKHLFGQKGPDESDSYWDRQIEPIVSDVIATTLAKGADLNQKGIEVASLCQNFQRSAEDLVRFREQIEKKGQDLDNAFGDIREVLSPQQMANIILFVQKYQFKKEIILFENDTTAEEKSLGSPIKRIKLEEL